MVPFQNPHVQEGVEGEGGGKRENALSDSTQRQMKLDDVAQRKSVNLGPHLFCQ